MRIEALPKVIFLAALCFEAASALAFDARIIERVSADALGTPYVEDPLGEGDDGFFDTDPLWRFDAYDCTTFVETMIAKAISRNESEFKQNLLRLRYRDGVARFEERNHFPDRDWIKNNTGNGLLADITDELFGAERLTRHAGAFVDKREWFLKLEDNRITNPALRSSPGTLAWALAKLRSLGEEMEPEATVVSYLPKETIVAHPELLDRIPSGTILSIVRPTWQVKADIGTNYNISHQGLVIRKDGRTYLRHASPTLKGVGDVLLIDYIIKVTLPSKSTGGINLLRIR